MSEATSTRNTAQQPPSLAAQGAAGVDTLLDWTFVGRSAWWLYLIGVVLLILFVHFGAILFVLPLRLLVGDINALPPAVASLLRILILAPFLIVPPLVVQWLHKRPWWSIAMPRPRVETWNLGIGALFAALSLLATWLIYARVFGIPMTFKAPDLVAFVPAVFFALINKFLQTASEEIVFRGYAMQAVRRFTASKLAIVVVSALLFAVPHYSNTVALGWPWYGILSFAAPAVLFAWMVLRTGSLWMPIGWHWMNNFALVTVIHVETDVGGGSALFDVARYPALEKTLATQVIVFFLSALAINYLIKRREQASPDLQPRG